MKTYFLVHIQNKNWPTEVVSYLSTGEQIYFLVIGSLYALLFFLYLPSLSSSYGKNLFHILICMTVFLLWRSVHLLILGSTRGVVTSPFLSEPPFFLFMAGNSIYAAFYYSLLGSTFDESKQKRTYYNLSLMVVFLLAAVCLAVCLVATLATTSAKDSRILTCYERIDWGDKYWTNPQIISIAYFATFVVISFIISVFKLTQGYKFHQMAAKARGVQRVARKYILLAIICSFAMSLQAISIITFGLIIPTRGIYWLRLTLLYCFELIPTILLLIQYNESLFRSLLGLPDTTSTSNLSAGSLKT
eukprot:TRINITY_DN5607_c0_g1_i12.p1 TRINITY_DN5607_c0_g1~~TRINITY_DN5607_c0_g1_i12.p1  ORF type:complete len:303 (-),score=39.51 TRINITY_DN5607_c0_g1_i12:15-923(-)